MKVGKFYFLVDFAVLDFIPDPRVSLILERPFLSTGHAIINVHEREIILRQDQQSLTIQCGDIPSIKKVEQINKIDFIDAGGRDFDSEEIENFINDDSIPIGVEDSPFNMEEDILFLESLLNEDPSPPHPIIPNQTKSPIEEPKHSFNMGLIILMNFLDLLFLSTLLRKKESGGNMQSTSISEDSDFDNPSVPLPPPEPPNEEFDFGIDFGDEISLVRNTIVKFECIDARMKFDVFNDENNDLSYFMFDKVFSLLSAESEDTIFDPAFVESPIEIVFSKRSLRTTKFRDRVELTTRIYP
nr:hypothetical protein [Tanacetum cinerariifolium]